MPHEEFAMYLGKESEKGFGGFVTADHFFLIFHDTLLTKDAGHLAAANLKETFSKSQPKDLAELENLMGDFIKTNNFSTGVSIASVLIQGSIIYLKTVGSGTVLIHRDNEFMELIAGDKSASGYIKQDDLYVLTTQLLVDQANGLEGLKQMKLDRNPHKAVEQLTFELKDKNDQGAISILLKIGSVQEEEVADEPIFTSASQPMEKFTTGFREFISEWRQRSVTMGKRRTITFAVLCLILIILIWSVGLGYQRRSRAANEKKIQSVRETVSAKLAAADQDAYLNPAQAQADLNDAKNNIEMLKSQLGKEYDGEISQLMTLVTNKENALTKKEEKSTSEFFDLTVDNASAQGNMAALDGNVLGIVDKRRGVLYTLSLDKKSLDSQQSGDLKNARLVSFYQDASYFYIPEKGIFTLKQNSVKKVIDADHDWGNITDMKVYNGNVYLLDNATGTIDKYMVTDSGYGAKSAYFASQSPDNLKNAHSMSIDGSLYLGFDDSITKFTGGVPVDFKTIFPNQDVHIDKIFTNKDIEKVFAWDKSKTTMYVLAKDGTYERQIQSSGLGTASDFTVWNNAIFLLSGSKIFIIFL